MAKSLERPSNSRDFDQFAKGQILGLDAWAGVLDKMAEDTKPEMPAEGDNQ